MKNTKSIFCTEFVDENSFDFNYVKQPSYLVFSAWCEEVDMTETESKIQHNVEKAFCTLFEEV